MSKKRFQDESGRFDGAIEFPVVQLSANEDFPPEQLWAARVAENDDAGTHGWNAYEIWHSHIRAPPGVKSRFLREL